MLNSILENICKGLVETRKLHFKIHKASLYEFVNFNLTNIRALLYSRNHKNSNGYRIFKDLKKHSIFFLCVVNTNSYNKVCNLNDFINK